MELDQETWIIVGIGIVALLAFGGAAFAIAKSRATRRARSDKLREQFGDEYAVTVERLGHRRGEAELQERVRRFQGMQIDRLPPDSREEHTERWKEIQYRFLEDPTYSVREAEHLIVVLMHGRGYPGGGFDTRVGAISVEHPGLAEPYRHAYETYRAVEAGEATVGTMFEAMLEYRSVFEALLERPQREDGVEGSSPPQLDAGEGRARPEARRAS